MVIAMSVHVSKNVAIRSVKTFDFNLHFALKQLLLAQIHT